MGKLADWLAIAYYGQTKSNIIEDFRAQVAGLEHSVLFWKDVAKKQSNTIEKLRAELAAAHCISELTPTIGSIPRTTLNIAMPAGATPPLKKRIPPV